MWSINVKSFVCGAVVGSLVLTTAAYAAPKALKLIVDGKELHTEVPAQIIDGSTMVPARGIAEALGASVTWDEANQTVIIETKPFAKLEDMNEAKAVQLAAAAQRHYWHAASGGEAASDGGPIETFSVEGSDYRWMGKDLDTKAKYLAYLQEVFTPKSAEAYWQAQTSWGGIVEIDGKLAQPNADGGSLMAWGQAKAALVQDDGSQKEYRFSVPVGDADPEQADVHVTYIEGQGWRIDDAVATIR
ncbi:DL-endopeptidase inhibitor IseA family protein [Paenibacillus hexagrammi]|uniref:Copper amine oxidase-like N-terminal domain-containing protein n=1 Tax=Paenibacillus hexagrammi TaxID=2908839 RepID=A0ABY3SHM4_9BACL|nr:DL-endopeptidase inhibitor IseA family protein [Paenibacillus sp. YPD9-1]UJF33005.1 hypothetical protein L0M14_26080 [Paenibacillus sp. YPD9-1]